MKKIIIVLLFSSFTYAIKGVIKALEVPLYLKNSSDSQILQNKRKGEIIFVNENSLNDDFYKTITNDGHDAYVNKKYVKLIHGNVNEFEENIGMFNDPTDYILEEPLPHSYPFSNRVREKASASLNINQGNGSYYDYPIRVKREQINPKAGVQLRYLSRASFDVENRLYYGFQLGATTSKNEFELEGTIFTTETQAIYQGGPVVTYTFYRRKKFEIDTSIHFSLNYHQVFVKQQSIPKNKKEERGFSGFSVSAVLSTLFIHKDIGKNNDFDFVHGPSLNYSPGYSLTTSAPGDIEEFWDTNQTHSPTKLSLSYSFGVMFRF
jgi:hypothetical protein